jgi:fructose-1,6-bisphosphatase/inositol monophosphatase family enzyme
VAELADFERVAVDLATAAGQRALQAFRGAQVLDFKGAKREDPVTVVDRETETFLREGLRAAFPDTQVEYVRGCEVDGTDTGGIAAAAEAARALVCSA